MHALILIAALSTTGGLFGGKPAFVPQRATCSGGNCGTVAASPAPYAQPIQQYAQPVQQYAQPVQQYAQPVQQYAQPIQQYAQPVQQYAQPVQQYAQPGYYAAPAQQYTSFYSVGSTCASGTCPQR